jgi:S-adenosylmethionine decarboxylase
MFFEGAEKRITIILNRNIRNVYNKTWWEHHIKDIGCNILSMISNNFYDIYLLSESILLVSENLILIKTCGITSPLQILSLIDPSFILNIIYSHPNFLNLDEQPILYQNPNNIINFIKKYLDVPLIYKKLLFLHSITNNLSSNHNEIILWEFEWNNKFISIIRSALSDWVIDDYIFEPQGYSLNGCNQQQYITIHCTPNKECSYISIEYKGDIKIDVFQEIINLLNPQKLGIISSSENILNLKIDKNYEYINENELYIKYYS